MQKWIGLLILIAIAACAPVKHYNSPEEFMKDQGYKE